MGWTGGGAVTRTDGVRTGSNVFEQQRDAGVPLRSDLLDAHANDLALAIAACLNRNGENAMAANLAMGGFRLTNMAAGVARTNSVRLGQVQDQSYNWCGTATGTSTLAVGTTPAITAYADGMRIWFRNGSSANTGNVDINVSSVGAVDLLWAVDTEIPEGYLPADAIVEAIYIEDESAFIIVAIATPIPVPVVPTGSVQMYAGSTAPTGWLLLNGDTIGSASSDADQDSDDYEALFTLVYDNMTDSEAPVSGGRGANAAADWAANKTITLPDSRGRAVIGSGEGDSLTARTHGDTGGAQTDTATTSTVNGSDVEGGGGQSRTSAHNHTVTVDIMQPWLALNFIVKV